MTTKTTEQEAEETIMNALHESGYTPKADSYMQYVLGIKKAATEIAPLIDQLQAECEKLREMVQLNEQTILEIIDECEADISDGYEYYSNDWRAECLKVIRQFLPPAK